MKDPRRRSASESKNPVDFIARNKQKIAELSQNQKLIRLNSQSVPRAPIKKKSAKKTREPKKPQVATLEYLKRPVNYMLVERRGKLDEAIFEVFSSDVSVLTSAEGSPESSYRAHSAAESCSQISQVGFSSKRKRSIDSSTSKRFKLSN